MKLLPSLSLILTLFAILITILVLTTKKTEKNEKLKKQKLTKRQITASEITKILDIRDRFLYSRDGFIFTYLKITPVSLDLLSSREKEVLSNILSAELSRETKPFKFLALSRPVDITSLIDEYALLLSASNDEKQKDLLRLEIDQMRQYMNCGEVVQRQFFIALWDKYFPGCEEDMLKRAEDFAISFEAANIGCEILAEDAIIRLVNMINNQAFIHLEDTDYKEYIPILNKEEI